MKSAISFAKKHQLQIYIQVQKGSALHAILSRIYDPLVPHKLRREVEMW